MRRTIIIGLLLLTAGCAGQVTPYVGKGSNALFLAWGSPVRTQMLPNYRQSVTFVNFSCETTFLLDPSGTVLAGTTRGPGCTP